MHQNLYYTLYKQHISSTDHMVLMSDDQRECNVYDLVIFILSYFEGTIWDKINTTVLSAH